MEKITRKKIIQKIKERTKLPNFKKGEKYTITWANLKHSVRSTGIIHSNTKKKTKFIILFDEILKAPIVIPLQMITDFKKIKT